MEDLQEEDEYDLLGSQCSKGETVCTDTCSGGDEAFDCWNTLEDQVQDPKDPEKVWNGF